MKKGLFVKKILIIIFVFVFQFTYGQSFVNSKNKGQKIIDITNSEYSVLKKQGKLSNKFEYRIDSGKTILSNIVSKPASPAVLSVCDALPTQGPLSFSVMVDDSPLLTVPIPFNFCFYGTTYTSLQLSANGNVQFSTNSTSFSSTGFPSSLVNMIAPFWSDGESMVSSGGLTYGKIYIDSHPTYMIISWDSLGYFSSHVDLLNSFQLVLSNGLDPILPPGKNVGFYYKTMQWTTGDASGGVNGFPSTQPGTPATVGANQGNGVDYFLIGRFGVPGSVYDGPLGNSDGISWLDGKRFFFDVCPPVGSNQSPASTLIGPCDTVRVCGNDSLIIQNAFIGPEVTQTVSLTASAPSLAGSFNYSVSTTGNSTAISMFVNGSTAPAGYHVVTMTATDNGTPVLSSSQTFIVYIDHSTVNSINGQIIFTPTIGICPGGSTTASLVSTGGVPASYLWNDNSSSSSTSFTMSPGLDSTVYVTVKSGQCQKTFKNYIRVNPVPVASIVGTTTLCSSTSSTTVLTATNTLNFAAQSPYTYSWTGSPTSPSPANTQTTSATGGTYSVTITNKYNCTSSAAITVTLVTAPNYTVVPLTPTICTSGSTSLTVSFGNVTPSTCGLSATGTCSSPNQLIIGVGANANTSTSYPSVYGHFYKNARHQMLYTAAELTAAGVLPGKISSVAFMVNSIPSGYIGTLPGVKISLKCTSLTTIGSSFDNSGLVQVYGGTNYTPIVGWNTHSFATAYEWDGISSILVDICYTWNGAVNYTTNPIMPSSTTAVARCIFDQDDSTPLCGAVGFPSTSTERPNIKFGNCGAANPAAFNYTWTPSTDLSSTNSATTIATPTLTTVYSVQVNPIGPITCMQSKSSTVTVVNPVTATITPVNPVCSNASTFTLSVIPFGGIWSGVGVTSSGVVTPSVALIGNNTYTYTVGSGTCSSTGNTTVSIEKFVPSTITGSISPLCNTNPSINLATAVITSTLGTGVWSGTGVTGTTFNPATAGAGTFVLTYSTNSTPTASLCPSSSTLAVTVNSLAIPAITSAGPYCDNYAAQNMTVSPTGGIWSAITSGASITSGGSFSPGSSVVGNNTILYTLTNGPCVNTATTTLNVVHFVPSTLTNTVGPYCIYDAATNLQAIAQFTGGVWSGPGVSGTSFSPVGAGAGVHVVTYSTNPSPLLNCGNSTTISITVNPKPEANAFPNATSGCNPVSIAYATSSYPTGLAVWDFGDGTPKDSGLIVNHTYFVPGTYTATLYYTDAIGCKDTTIATSAITSNPLPIASFDPSVIETTVVDGQVEFTNHSTVLTNNSYTWDIGGLYTSTNTNESYLFVNSGNFVVTLTATTPELCVDDTSIVIVVNPDVVLYVPNAFTPGTDGLNDVFQIFLPPTGVDFSTFSLVVYDRWGEIVYKTTDVNQCWTGAKNNSGDVLKQDVYVYKINFKDEKKKNYERVGHVSLLHK